MGSGLGDSAEVLAVHLVKRWLVPSLRMCGPGLGGDRNGDEWAVWEQG